MQISHLNKLLAIISFIFVANIALNHSAQAQGCGSSVATGDVLCLDYKNRSINLSHCNARTGQIGPSPSAPTASCPNTCCTETHRVDGVIQGTPELKPVGTCNSTSRTTTCEERGDCAPVCPPATNTENRNRSASCPSGQTGSITIRERRTITTNADCTTSNSSWSETSRNDTCTAGPACTASSRTENRNRSASCPSGQTGSITINERRTVTTNADCTTSNSSWTETSRNDTCVITPTTCTPSSRTENRNRSASCPSGQTGSITIRESRTVTTNADCTTSNSSWSETSRNPNCTAAPTCTPSSGTENRSRNATCPSGQAGSITINERRTVTTNANCTTSNSSWSEVSRNSNCQPVCTPSTRTESRNRNQNCPPGQTGNIVIGEQRTITRNSSCNDAVGSWREVSRNNTCRCTPSTTTIDRMNKPMGCPSGQTGNIQYYYEKYRTVNSSCTSTTSSWVKVGEAGTCCPYNTRNETRTRRTSCASGWEGGWTITEQRTITNSNCTTSTSGWSETARTGRACYYPDYGGPGDHGY